MAESETSTLGVTRNEPEIWATGEYDRGVIGALAHQRRRFTIHALKHEAGPVSLGDLATWIVSWETDVDPEEVPKSAREVVETSLLRHHLPALAELGLIEFEHQTRTIVPGEWIIDHQFYVGAADRPPRFWAPYYLASSIIAIIGVILSWQGAWPVIELSVGAWMAVVVVGLGGLALVHHRRRSKYQLGRGDRPPEVAEQ